ncbi:PQQ-binding-like beta-propeller repeat protein [Streptomyces sp. NPDC091281]|uniref:outer membrane protein assembly factor BamB family protein n=1 Tax=Streptomyces sp. NPDC091281 TaxID=3365985 RepID=UPI0037F46B3B
MTQSPPPPPGTPEDRPPQDTPPQDTPPQGAAPQDTPPRDTPPQGAAPEGEPSTGATPPPPPGFGPPPPPQGTPDQPAAPATPPAQAPSLDKAAPPATPPAAPPAAPPAPPTPPAPSYGYPQSAGAPQPPQTPPPPGYGYPGQPGAPVPPGTPNPGTPNPYGAPQQPYGAPQPGYGYPTAPYPQQGHPQQGYPGYPGQPTVPMPPQAPAGRRGINAPVAIVLAAVVAIALIVGAGVLYAGSDDGDGGGGKKNDTASSSGTKGGTDDGDGKGTGGTPAGGTEKAPADPASKLLFQIPSPKVAKDDSVVVSGSWLTEKTYVKAGVAEIAGYDPDKGTRLWTIKLPGPVCTASKYATEDGKTAVVFQPKMPEKNRSAGCSQVAAIDLDAGKQLWTKTSAAGDYPITFDNVTVSGTTVALGATEGGSAFDINTGKSLWSPKQADTCYDAGYGGGPKLVAIRKCGPYDARQLQIQTIDPVSGKVLSEYKMTSGIEYAAIVSTDPLVVAADVGDSAGDGSGISDFFSIDNKTGKLKARLSAPGDQFAARCDGITKIEQCSGLAVGADRLYIPTEEHDGGGDYSRTNEIVSFDLNTGKQTGQRADAGDGYELVPLRMDGKNVIAYKRAPYDEGGQIVSVDGGSFKQTKLLQNPSTQSVRDAESRMLPEYSELIFARGHLYMAAVYADSSGAADEKEYLALAFGTTG